MAAVHDFTVEQNADFSADLTWKDDEGNVMDLTGYTAEMDIRYGQKNGRLAIQLDTTVGGITIESNTIKLRMNAATTIKLRPETCYYDLLLRKDSDTIRLVEGKVYIKEGVTK